jgi:hypothetical protein
MKHKLALLIFALALLFAVCAAPVYAGDEDSADCTYGVGAAACSGGGGVVHKWLH